MSRPTVQTKLTIGAPNDKYEKEANRVADAVMRMPDPDGNRPFDPKSSAGEHIQRMCPECEEELQRKAVNEDEEELLQTKAVPGQAPDLAPGVTSEIQTVRGEGNPLPESARQFFEPRFGHDFRRVRVHADHEAGVAARSVRARAYTFGHDIVFGAGEYAPGTVEGKRLLAHELVHVVQQSAGTIASPKGVLQRYSHEDCTEADLRTHIWPADGIAKRKVDAAIAAVTASPVSPSTEALFAKYFMTRTPDVTTIAKVFRKLKAAFDRDVYTYECEEDCKPGKNAYSGWAWDIHLCMNNLRGRANDCIARTIIHEFTHKYAGAGHGWWFSIASCYNGCDTAGCPSNLSPSDALGNAYSFAGFAHEV